MIKRSAALLCCVQLVLIATSQAFLSHRSPNVLSSVSQKMPQRAIHMTEEAAEENWTGAQAWSKKSEGIPVVKNVEEIASILPHRYPFALVDKVIEMEPGKKIVGVKCITMNEPQFTGHFPDRPIMPGVLMVEAMAQLGGVLCLSQPLNDPNEGSGIFFFGGVDGVRWKRPVVPGDVLVMEMELKKWNAKFGIAKLTGKAYVEGKIAVDVSEFTFALQK
uniref:3-hydroxyacyl-[acyl-carrier-protein] dehydratase n=1 Tax=Fibrocapsa japonica TaxID=94617 RepID=A0A7S2XX69_9STRA|mmetsp:Transcript_2140/g.3144  ORF Transcript_2140/g.3144 Transcript_2140/m.3144 type:complete len:219 (+) Transcript_2140:107-763(+)|eukprot:CAMPEP_0113933972 /NCGR_PEP_ID=MMETSP1339-20121228/1330_1 /TAXON_ID=94617 /ORGANISM="Fibrocapsa japonica" /LENGTH=218 /DNA_ID=CAMNT_0000935567 /DNA_START=85 /DNA_END=741 /DNA_ORIENTATION=+ /assembly_acc=CAM_ASM_000762